MGNTNGPPGRRTQYNSFLASEIPGYQGVNPSNWSNRPVEDNVRS